jgi:TolB protein
MLIGSDGRPALYLVDVDTRAAVACDYSGPGFLLGSPAWSPDGRRLVMLVETSGAPVDLVTFAAGGGAPCGSDARRLTYSAGGAFGPAWSPDGHLIAYICPDRAYSHLCVVPAAGGAPRQITFGINAGLPNWRP